MAQNKTLEVWNGLPTWAKGAIAVGGVAILYFTGRWIVKSISAGKGKREQLVTINEIKDDIRVLNQQGVRPSYPDSQYTMWANKIKNAFDGCDPLEVSQNTVNQIFRELKNDADFAKLVQAWGTKTYDQCGWGTGDVTGDLTYAIRDELDDTEIRNANKILSDKGIKYRI